jgi:hypothetical protein
LTYINKRSLGGAAIIASVIFLPGCLPWPISLALDGISYAASGKTISDHFISGFMQQDCAVGRAVINQTDICEAPEALTILAESINEDRDLDIAPASSEDHEADPEWAYAKKP